MSTLHKVLLEFLGNQDGTRIYSWREDFEALWFLSDNATPVDDPTIIIWDGWPDREAQEVIPIENYLTPVDWAAGNSIRHGRQCAEDQDSVFLSRVVIVNCHPDYSVNTPAMKFYESFRAAVPWIEVLDVDEGLPAISAAVNTLAEKCCVKRLELDTLARYWTVGLLKTENPGDHHALANILGPVMLLGATTGAVLHRTLVQLMAWLGICKQNNMDSPPFGIVWGNEADLTVKLETVIRYKTKVRAFQGNDIEDEDDQVTILLLDDCAFKHKWSEVLCKGLGISIVDPPTRIRQESMWLVGKDEARKIRLLAMDSPSAFLDLIEAEGLNRHTFSFTLAGESIDMLFLDLRLFQHSAATDEADFFQRLLNMRHEPMTPSSDAKAWIDGILTTTARRETGEYVQALTLFPKLLTQIDFSLPIVLFSSTGRREIIETLKPYDSIITSFEKPRLDAGLSGDLVANTSAHLREAFDRALSFVTARQKCRAITALSGGQRGSFRQLHPNPTNSKCYIELCLDEHNDDQTHKMTLGGCFGIWLADTLEAAIQKADVFDDTAVASGVRYFHNLGVGSPARSAKQKNIGCQTELDSTLMSLQQQGPNSFLGTIFLSHPNANRDPVHALVDPRSIDNQFRFTLNALLELFLVETVPALLSACGLSEEDTVISVYGATRVKYVDNEATANSLSARWGLAGFPIGQNGQRLMYSLSRQEIYPIISRILDIHGKKMRLHRTYAVQMPYMTDNQYPEYFYCRACRWIQEISIHKGDLRELRDNAYCHLQPNQHAGVIANTGQRDQGYLFVATSNHSQDVFSHVNTWQNQGDFHGVQIGDFVIIEVMEGQHGLQTVNARRMTVQEVCSYNNAPRVPRLRHPMVCPHCNSGANIRPDYRALQYVIDQVLPRYISHGWAEANEYRDSFGQSMRLPGEFEGLFDESMRKAIRASRHLSQGDLVQAIVDLPVLDVTLLQDRNPQATSWIASRITHELPNLKEQWAVLAAGLQRT